MNLRLSIDCYKGVDGSSLSQTRCIKLFKYTRCLKRWVMLEFHFSIFKRKPKGSNCSVNTKAKSAIRTFFPLLKKIRFVDYEGEFSANSCFTELGTQFVLACRAISSITDDTPNKDLVLKKLNVIKQRTQIKGLINMYNDPEYKNHNIWIALKLLKTFHLIHWNEFLYSLYCIDNGDTLEYAIDKIRLNKKEIDKYVFLNEDNKDLPNTCYSYIRSYLEESGLICKVSSQESKLTEEASLFFSTINI